MLSAALGAQEPSGGDFLLPAMSRIGARLEATNAMQALRAREVSMLCGEIENPTGRLSLCPQAQSGGGAHRRGEALDRKSRGRAIDAALFGPGA